MTLNDILTSALAQLDRGGDPQTLEAFAPRLTAYVNEAQADIARAISFCRTESVTPVNGIIDLGSLERDCIRVLKTVQLGHEVRFTRGDTGCVALPYNEQALITYVCVPKPLALPADVSELPAYTHGLLVGYAVARERMAGDVSTQRGANIYLSMYEAAKARLRPHPGDAESYRLINRY